MVSGRTRAGWSLETGAGWSLGGLGLDAADSVVTLTDSILLVLKSSAPVSDEGPVIGPVSTN